MDPYKRFSDLIQKLNFGSPFVDHVAKKTYVKSKNSGHPSSEENNLNYLTIDSEFNYLANDQSFDEEEYQKLLEEFGDE